MLPVGYSMDNEGIEACCSARLALSAIILLQFVSVQPDEGCSAGDFQSFMPLQQYM
jgi:hypothetical protein